MSRLEEIKEELPYTIRYHPDVERLISRLEELENENKRYKQALENIEELWANREFNDNLAWDMLLEARQALKGESQ